MADDFDPDAYLKRSALPTDFDPDAYLKRSTAPSLGAQALDVAKQIPSGLVTGTEGIATFPAQAASFLGGLAEKIPGLAPSPEQAAKRQELKDLIAANRGGGIAQYLPEPQTPVGKVARTGAEFVPGFVAGGRGSIPKAAGVGATAGAASEVAGQATEGTALELPARIAASIAVPSAVSRLARPRDVIPGLGELRTQKNAAYARAEDLGVVVTPQSYAGLADDVFKTAAKNRLDPILTANSNRVVQRIQELTDPRVGPITLETVDTMRQLANDAWKAAQPKSNDRRVANLIKDRIDNWADKLTSKDISRLGGGDHETAISAFKEARALNARLRQGEAVQEAITEGTRRGQRLFTGAGVEHGIRTQFENLYRREGKRMPEDLRAAVGAVGAPQGLSGFLANRVRDVGRFAQRGPVSVGLALGLGATTDPGTALGAAALGEAGRFAATRMTRARARAASELARRGPAPQPQFASPAMPSLMINNPAFVPPRDLTQDRIAKLLALRAAISGE